MAPTPPTVLLVCGDDYIRLLLAYCLEKMGCTVREIDTAAAGLALALADPAPDLLLVEEPLNDKVCTSGHDMMVALRETGSFLPAIVVMTYRPFGHHFAPEYEACTRYIDGVGTPENLYEVVSAFLPHITEPHLNYELEEPPEPAHLRRRRALELLPEQDRVPTLLAWMSEEIALFLAQGRTFGEIAELIESTIGFAVTAKEVEVNFAVYETRRRPPASFYERRPLA